jgi:hypothetical protein
MTLSRWLGAGITLVAAAVLPACDGINLQKLEPGVSTSAEIRSRMGEPDAEYRNDDGSVVWEYNRQPNGSECQMLSIGPDGVLQKVEQVLTEANFVRVHAGMSKDAVRRLLGAPGSATVFRLSGEEVWDWRIASSFPNEEAHFHVHFASESGLSTKTSRRIEHRG